MKTDALEFFRATTIVLSDWPTHPTDALFFHARGHGDDDRLFDVVRTLGEEGLVRHVVINGSDGSAFPGGKAGGAWEGTDRWSEKLHQRGIEHLRCVPAYNTKDENEAFLSLAQEKGWRSGVLLAQPHQILRCMLGMIKSMETRGYWLRIYAAAPRACSWRKEVVGSYIAGSRSRFDHIAEEAGRIPRYQEKGDLVTFEGFYSYLDRRSSIR